MAELMVPVSEYKKALEVAKALEDEKVAQMDPETKANYFKTRTAVAEEELAKLTLAQAKAELKEKFPAADPDEVDGKTVSELEESFKRSENRNKAAYERAQDAIRKEFEEKLKGADEEVQKATAEVFKAWGRPRVPTAEDTKIATDQAARQAMVENGINPEQTQAPTTIDDIIMSKLPQVGQRLFRKAS